MHAYTLKESTEFYIGGNTLGHIVAPQSYFVGIMRQRTH